MINHFINSVAVTGTGGSLTPNPRRGGGVHNIQKGKIWHSRAPRGRSCKNSLGGPFLRCASAAFALSKWHDTHWICVAAMAIGVIGVLTSIWALQREAASGRD
jgi:hypothetical protein